MNDTPLPLDCTPMDTQIFNQSLSVEAISAYIIVTALIGDGVRPLLASVQKRWNASPENLEPALKELEALNVIERLPGLAEEGLFFMVNPASLWGVKTSWPESKPLPLNPRPPKD